MKRSAVEMVTEVSKPRFRSSGRAVLADVGVAAASSERGSFSSKGKSTDERLFAGAPALAAVRKGLPIAPFAAEFVAKLRANDVLVLVGATGSGKSTQIPQYVYHGGLLQQQEKQQPLQVVVTQPRRVAAITLSRRVALEMGGKPNHPAVAYTVRFDDTSTHRTRIKYATDGMLLREAQLDPLLSKYAVICLDEAHERSLSTDILFSVAKNAQLKRKAAADAASDAALPPLKIVVMSATLDVGLFTRFFASESGIRVDCLTVPGRQHPVDVFYAQEAVSSYVDAAVATVLQIHMDWGAAPGDILVFLPGQEDIEDVSALLQSKWRIISRDHVLGAGALHADSGDTLVSLHICPLFASMSRDAQLAAFNSAPPNTRKIILATNIAETSVTISGIRAVVDTGKVKVRFSAEAASSIKSVLNVVDESVEKTPNITPTERALAKSVTKSQKAAANNTAASAMAKQRGPAPARMSPLMESLMVVDVSQAQAIQRAGRAGRDAPGECYRLYTQADFHKLPEHAVSEIQRVSIAASIAQLLSMGLSINDIYAFPWLQPPPDTAVKRAVDALQSLGALMPHPSRPGDQCLSEHGKQMAAFPLEPQYAHLLIRAASEGCAVNALAIISVLASDSLWVSPGREKQGDLDAARKKFASLEGDHITLLSVFRSFERCAFLTGKDLMRKASTTSSVAGYGAGDGVKTVVLADDVDIDEEIEQAVQAETRYEKRSGGSGSARHGFSLSLISSAHILSGRCVGAADKAVVSSFARAAASRLLEWCKEHFLSFRALRKAVSIRDQLADVCAQTGVSLFSAADVEYMKSLTREGSDAASVMKQLLSSHETLMESPLCCSEVDNELLMRTFAVTLRTNVAFRLPSGISAARIEYRTQDGSTVAIHPSSSLVLVYSHLRNRQAALAAAAARKGVTAASKLLDEVVSYPEAVLFAEVIHTSRGYMRHVTRVNREWLDEAAKETNKKEEDKIADVSVVKKSPKLTNTDKPTAEMPTSAVSAKPPVSATGAPVPSTTTTSSSSGGSGVGVAKGSDLAAALRARKQARQ